MKVTTLFLLSALGVTAVSCTDRPSPAYDGPSIAINVAPFEIDAVTNASYRLTVRNAANQVVWQRDVDADGYGDGGGSISYVGPCDAMSNPNKVSVEVLELFKGPNGTEPFDPSLYGLPGEVSRDVDCVANQDTAVSFDITILIDPPDMPAFLSIGIGFADIFCSAKLDCEDSNGDPLRLLFDANGQRAQTAVVAIACTAGAGAETVLYRSDLAIHCDDNGATAGGNLLDVTVDPAAGPGNLSTAANGGISGDAGVLFAAQVSQGDELIANYNKAYWNVALGLTAGAKGCTLTATATANDGRWPADTLPAGQVWPYIDWNVNLTDTSGALVCTTHPLGGADTHAGTSALYSDGSAVTWPHVYLTAVASDGLVGDLTLASAGHWADGTYAASCDAYRHPTDGHAYAGATGDGVYTVDPDGAGANAPFNVYCDMTTDDGGWTLLATLNSTTTNDTVNWPTWTADWWTIAHGTPTDPTIVFSNQDLRLFRPLIAPTTVLRTNSPAASVSRYHFNMTQADWDLWNMTRTVAGFVLIVGPFDLPTSTQVSTSPTLSLPVAARMNGHWDWGYFILGSSPAGGFADAEGLGARYHVGTATPGSYGYVGNVLQNARWHFWLK